MFLPFYHLLVLNAIMTGVIFCSKIRILGPCEQQIRLSACTKAGHSSVIRCHCQLLASNNVSDTTWERFSQFYSLLKKHRLPIITLKYLYFLPVSADQIYHHQILHNVNRTWLSGLGGKPEKCFLMFFTLDTLVFPASFYDDARRMVYLYVTFY